MNILVIDGPNLNLLGTREPQVYGYETLEDIRRVTSAKAETLGIAVEHFQSNYEGAIIDKIHSAMGRVQGIIINPGALSHYSYAIRDALAAVSLPAIEVHISNISAREEFRARSVITPVCCGSIAGLGAYSYILAVYALAEYVLKERDRSGREY